MIQPHDAPRPLDPGGDAVQHTGPVFADPSGQRRRLLRVLGAVASVLLVGALITAGIGLFGGPNTPFSVFGSPVVQGNGHQGTSGSGHSAGGPAPGSSGSLPSGRASGSAPAGSKTPSPSPSTSQDRSPTPTPSSSPVPTNKAGKTPPGQGRSKSSHPSPSSTHGR